MARRRRGVLHIGSLPKVGNAKVGNANVGHAKVGNVGRVRRTSCAVGMAALLWACLAACSGGSSKSARPPLARVAPAQWTTYHHDAARTGVDTTSPAVSNVHRQWTSDPLDGLIYGEPLVSQDTVIAATENDTVYALDAATGKTRWSQHVGAPIAGDPLLCRNITPSGITGTSVIGSAGGMVWVAAFVQPGRHQLFGLDLATGAIRSQRSVDPPGADPMVEQQRGALTLSGGRVYVPFGGLYGDC